MNPAIALEVPAGQEATHPQPSSTPEETPPVPTSTTTAVKTDSVPHLSIKIVRSRNNSVHSNPVDECHLSDNDTDDEEGEQEDEEDEPDLEVGVEATADPEQQRQDVLTAKLQPKLGLSAAAQEETQKSVLMLSKQIVEDIQLARETDVLEGGLLDNLKYLASYQDEDPEAASPVSPMSPVANSPRNRQTMLLHKRISADVNSLGISPPASPIPHSFITSTNLHELAVTSNIPQWLMYTWTAKSKDKSLKSPETQQMIAELMLLKHYALPATLCEVLPTAQHDAAIRNWLVFFQFIHRALKPKPATGANTNGVPSISMLSSQVGASSGGVDPTMAAISEPNSSHASSVTSVQAVPGRHSVSVLAESSDSSRLLRSRRRDHIIGFLEEVIRREVSNAKSDAQLFRSNNIVSRLLTLFANGTAKEYLYATLHQPILDVLAMGTMEVDPLKLRTDPTMTEEHVQRQVDANMQKLLHATNLIMNAILLSADKCPIGLKKLATVIQRQVEKKFAHRVPVATLRRPRGISASAAAPPSIVGVGTNADVTVTSSISTGLSGGTTGVDEGLKHHVAVRGFIFLRVICPAMVSPDALGLVNKPLTTPQRRSLVLISKIIQNIANCVRFGTKEEYMIPANVIAEENEVRVDKYCDALLSLDHESVYMVSEMEDKVFGKREEWQGVAQSLMDMFQLQMDKMLQPLKLATVSEHLSYNVFGALKAILRQFRTVEQGSSAANGTVEEEDGMDDTAAAVPPVTNDSTAAGEQEYSITKQDTPLLHNFVLLGGMEEVLMMNDFVLVRALLSPHQYAKRLANSLNNPKTITALSNEMDALVRSSVHLLCPHGGDSLAMVVEWVFRQEILLRKSRLASEDVEMDEAVLVWNMLDVSCKGIGEDGLGTPLAQRLTQAFFFAIGMVYNNEQLTALVDELGAVPSEQLEIDPRYLDNVDVLKENLERLVAYTERILQVLVHTTSKIPPCMRDFCAMLYTHLGGNRDDPTAPQSQQAALHLANLVFQRLFCPILATPDVFGYLDGVGDRRQFLLISYKFRYLSQCTLGVPKSSNEYPAEYLNPLVERWKAGSLEFVQNLLAHVSASSGTPASSHRVTSTTAAENGESLMEETAKVTSLSTAAAEEMTMDEPISVSDANRARAILTLRKFLHRKTLKYLRSIIDYGNTSGEGTIHGGVAGNRKTPRIVSLVVGANATAGTPAIPANLFSSTLRKELNGRRDHTLQYQLLDRMRIVFWGIQNNGGLPAAPVPPPPSGGELLRGAGEPSTPSTKSPEEVLNNRARRGTISNKIQTDIRYTQPANAATTPAHPALKASPKKSGFFSRGSKDHSVSLSTGSLADAASGSGSGSGGGNISPSAAKPPPKWSQFANTIASAQNTLRSWFSSKPGRKKKGKQQGRQEGEVETDGQETVPAVQPRLGDRGLIGAMRTQRMSTTRELEERVLQERVLEERILSVDTQSAVPPTKATLQQPPP